MTIPGIHHVTAIASDPQRNLDFYTQVLGLRLVKLTVNFDESGSYHFYFGNETGAPGTILTFFPWTRARRGKRGAGETASVAFSVPSLAGWSERLPGAKRRTRFGQELLAFEDPDGMALELVEAGGIGGSGITGFHGVTLAETSAEATAQLLMETFGYTRSASDGDRVRYTGQAGDSVDIVPGSGRASMGAGTVHHVAFRAETDEIQVQWQLALAKLGYSVTPVLDRQYFHSIYFREPGGVLFEIATDAPGFATDEAVATLGTHLMLPPWFEANRPEIEEALPKLKMPHYAL